MTLTFVSDNVVIEGQGLHALYVGLSEFKVTAHHGDESGGLTPYPVIAPTEKAGPNFRPARPGALVSSQNAPDVRGARTR